MMRKQHCYLDMVLDLFEGGAAGAAGAAAGGAASGDGAAGDGQQAEASQPVNPQLHRTSRRGAKPGEFDKVVYGKQAEATAGETGNDGTHAAGGEAGKNPQIQTSSNALDEKRQAFHDLVSGEYKDIYTEETQRMINRRFADHKAMEQQLQSHQPIIDMLCDRYGVKDGDIAKLQTALEGDDAYWAEAADEAGMTTEQYKHVKSLERQLAQEQAMRNHYLAEQRAQQQLDTWYGEAETLKTTYPGFDLRAEVQNPAFTAMLKAGVPMQNAYEVTHMEEIKAGLQQQTAQHTEKRIADNIRAQGTRPAENGASATGAFVVKSDVHKLTKADRAEIARRVQAGETGIRFS